MTVSDLRLPNIHKLSHNLGVILHSQSLRFFQMQVPVRSTWLGGLPYDLGVQTEAFLNALSSADWRGVRSTDGATKIKRVRPMVMAEKQRKVGYSRAVLHETLLRTFGFCPR